MKKRIAILLSFALMFTSVFGMGVSYAAEETGKDFNLSYEFYDDDGKYIGNYYYQPDAEDFSAAKTAKGHDVVLPAGLSEAMNNEENGFVAEVCAYYNPDTTNIVDLDLPYDKYDGDENYKQTIEMKGLFVDGSYTHVITATLSNDEEVVYTFNFVDGEEGGDFFEINNFYASYYDDNGNEKQAWIVSSAESGPVELSSLAKGISIEVPYYYNKEKGISLHPHIYTSMISYGGLIKTDIAPKYIMTGDTITFNITFTSLNGEKSVTIPVTITRDTDGTNAELDRFRVEVYEYWDSDDSYVSEWIEFDNFTVNQKNEIYLSIPSEYECYYWDDDSFCEWMNIEYITDVTLYAYAKNGARFKVVDSDGWTNMQDETSVKMEGYGYENCVEDDVVLEVQSPNGKIVNPYTVKVIVSDCDGDHTFSTWQTEKAPTCTEKGLEVHKCRYCPYKEYREVENDDVHTPGEAATCTTAQICTTCKQVLVPEKGHTPGEAATCTTAQICTTCKQVLVPEKGHTPGTEATCTTPQTCTLCQIQLSPAKGHTAVAPILKKATTKVDGSVVTKCGCGAVLSTEIIKKASKVTLSTDAYTYNGKTKSPKIVVKDSAGKTISSNYYTVSKPSGRKAIGKYTYTVNFKGNYSGTQKLTLTIKPVKTTIQTPKAEKKAITVKWKKGSKSQVSGYEVMVATNSKFSKNKKTATVKGYSKTSYKMSKLKAKTKYYVRVRTYKTVKGVKIYSDWSKVKTIKTK